MIQVILGTKIGQTQKFTSDGERVPVTQIQAGPCFVMQIKAKEKDGYAAVQLGLGTKREKVTKKPVLGHIKKAGIQTIPRFLREVSLEKEEEFKLGQEIRLEGIFKPGDLINVTGISKGKGFTGVVKRWGFAGGPRTHGQSDRERAPGSIGAGTTPGRVIKGKRMAGRSGGEQVTVRNLLVLDLEPERGLLLVKGSVPGNKKGLLIIKKVGEDKKFIPKEVQNEQETQEEPVQEAQGEGVKNGGS